MVSLKSLVVAALASLSLNGVMGASACAGCKTSIEASSTEVMAVASSIQGEILSYPSVASELEGLTFFEVDEASRQVVNGLMYEMVMEYRGASKNCNPAPGIIRRQE